MEFRKFDSLENTYNGKYIEAVRNHEASRNLWIVSEKIDGANFGLYFDGTEHAQASRNQFVDGTFFACAEVVDALRPKIEHMYQSLQDRPAIPEFKELLVYGELYGPNVQGRVNYGEKNFIGFDVLLDGVPLNKIMAIGWMMNSGINVSPVLFVGSFEAALAYKHNFRSHLTPADFVGENECEGVVIEPAEPSWMYNGKRIYFKHKTEAFSERKAPAKIKEPELIPENVAQAFEELSALLTEARVFSVISKEGEVDGKDFGRILKLVINDAVDELNREQGREIGRELGASTGQLMKLLAKEATGTVRAVLFR